MNKCLICQNNTNKSEHNNLCIGCQSFVHKPKDCCFQCGIELHVQQTKCGACLNKPPSFNQTLFSGFYQEPLDKWVMALKFGKKVVYSKLMAELMKPLLNQIESDYILMPVPLHKARLRMRGYNQAYEIAKELSKLTNMKLNVSMCRNKDTKMQALLKFKERAKNVRGAFSVSKTFSAKKVVLIDDVMTSGNTLNECSKTLLKAGAKSVKVLVFARKSL